MISKRLPLFILYFILGFFVVACSGNAEKHSLPVSTQNPARLSSGVVAIDRQASEWPVAFVLPWDDASEGITSFAQLNHKPAGSRGRLGINSAGQFEMGGERVKFWGVNITGASSFPSHAQAKAIAARLAKFGVNIVRFHHMENNWGGESLIDYSAGNSRSFNTSALQRLDYFVAQLKAQGIYININLQTSREFMTGDGLPAAVNQLDWKQRHILGYLSDTVRELEKEHAKKFLQHVNPYTGLSYAQDPAVAIVEINNENSIYQQYFDGNIDDWPEPFIGLLSTSWNAWLGRKYSSDSALHEAWGVIRQPPGEAMLANGNFNTGVPPWNLEQHNSARATVSSGSFAGKSALQISVDGRGEAAWNVQLNQQGLTLTEGQVYTLKFSAMAENHRRLSLSVMQAYAPWRIYETIEYDLTDNWQDYTFTFVAGFSDTRTRINFGGLGASLGRVYLADVQLNAGGALGQLPPGQSLAQASIAVNKYAQRYTAGRSHDWTEFLYSLEQDYWRDMHRFLTRQLNIQGLAYGTIGSLSPPSVQAGFGFLDGHIYWCHPHFPAQPWHPVDWVVRNESMVNTLAGNTLATLARQRVIGRPFTVSEYQHSMPNFYIAEAPLMLAAYAALQDWDGAYFFTYENGGQGWDAGYFSGFMQTNNHPAAMVNIAVAANLFRRGDVAAAQTLAAIPFNEQIQLQQITQAGRSWNVIPENFPATAEAFAFAYRTGLDIDASEPAPLPAALGNVRHVISETGQLAWDTRIENRGVLTINTAASKGVVGFVEAGRYRLGNLQVEFGLLELDWASLMLTARTGSFDRLDSGATFLAVATARVENSGMQWKDDTYSSVGKHWGSAPSLVEVVPFTLELPVAARRLQAWALDERGQRKQALSVVPAGAGAMVIADGSAQTLWYELELAPLP